MNESQKRVIPKITSVNKGKRFQDLTGRKFSNWTAISFAGRTSKTGASYWKCKCSCGIERLVATSNLLLKKTLSCGSCGAFGRFNNLAGQRFGRLLVIKCVGRNKSGSSIWECKCDCGNVRHVWGVSMKRGNSKSCGCLQRDYAKTCATRFLTTHGMTKSTECKIWNSMKQRCSNVKNSKFVDYGGRGIKVCQRWLNSFENFYSDMGPRPSKGHSIGRMDNDGNYEPSNCKWETVEEQVSNKRNTTILFINGKSVPLPIAARIHKIKPRLIRDRIKSGWSHERAVCVPVRATQKKYVQEEHSKDVGCLDLQLPLQ